MLPFLKINKKLAIYSFGVLLVLPIFGFNFLISFVGNILLLIFLLPLLIFLIFLISLNSFKSKVKTCNKCGVISIGENNICINCGTDINDPNIVSNEKLKNASETTIEVKAEEIK